VTNGPRRISIVLAIAGGVLLVVGARLILLGDFGYDLPYFDQWVAEGALLIIPWRAGHLEFSSFFQPHNEHRIPLTRLLAYAQLVLDGQWNNLAQSVLNLPIAAAGIAAVLVAIRKAASSAAVGTSAALVFIAGSASPLSWENILVGFQSQFYFMALYAVVATLLCVNARPLSARWFFGLAVVGASLLNMASGFFIAAPLAARHGVLSMFRRDKREAVAAVLLLSAFVAGAYGGLTTARAGVIQEHRDYLVTVRGFLDCLAWPLPPELKLLAFLQWCPSVALCVQSLRRGETREDPRTWVVLCLAAWVAMQCGAMALARAHMGQLPSSRYVDILLIGSAVQLLALGLLNRSKRFQVATVLVFAAVMLIGFTTRSRQQLALDLPYKRATTQTQMRNVRAFLSGDESKLSTAAFPDSPHPDVPWLMGLLRNPALVDLLPPSVAPHPRCERASGVTCAAVAMPFVSWSETGEDALDPAMWRYAHLDSQGHLESAHPLEEGVEAKLVPSSRLSIFARQITGAGPMLCGLAGLLLLVVVALSGWGRRRPPFAQSQG
jgi:hypothetical protein